MEIWFELSVTAGIIEKVEVEKYTAKSIWVKAGYKYVRRSPRTTYYTEYHPTFAEAFQSGRGHLLKRIAAAQREFNEQRRRLNHFDQIDVTSLSDPPKYDTPLLGLQNQILSEEIDIEITRKETK